MTTDDDDDDDEEDDDDDDDDDEMFICKCKICAESMVGQPVFKFHTTVTLWSEHASKKRLATIIGISNYMGVSEAECQKLAKLPCVSWWAVMSKRSPCS